MHAVQQLELAGTRVLHLGTGTPRRPVLVWLHGGGFGDGCADDALGLANALVDQVDVLLPAYPLAPQHRFPVPLEATHAVLRAVLACGNRREVIVGGERAGGNLAAALALRTRDEGLRGVVAQVLVAPLLDPSQNTPSMRAAQGCPCARAWREYLASPADALHPYAAPLFASRLAGLPAALIVTGTNDPARDEADQYAQRLRDQQVPVQLLRIDVPVGPLMNAADPGDSTIRSIDQFLARHVGGGAGTTRPSRTERATASTRTRSARATRSPVSSDSRSPR